MTRIRESNHESVSLNNGWVDAWREWRIVEDRTEEGWNVDRLIVYPAQLAPSCCSPGRIDIPRPWRYTQNQGENIGRSLIPTYRLAFIHNLFIRLKNN